ncbi:MAG: maltose alpha-D-glucosyltransferase [Verrucomicrobiota bacterium]|jgi:maltose alpha-D-glucosyltransferase/alpha-amylase
MSAPPGEKRPSPAPEPFWYKSGVIYELHVRAFYDANGDGTGDFRGLTEKLDYLRDLGVTAVWLLPFYPSPLKDDGYDIADYYGVHPMYGTLNDFKLFLREAHHRGLRVITELVLNHTSDQHPWFQRARRAKPGSRWRNFYVWGDDPQKYKDAPIIFNGVEVSNWTLDPVAGTYFWHRFFSHQPDLNFDNPEVRDEMFKVVDFWLSLGVDGLRLDAVPYLYEREGTTCENLPETHAFLKSLRAHVDEKYGDRMLLAEANLWPEEAVSYFGQGRGDECHMAFHFPLMPRLFMALRMEDRLPITEILEQTPVIPETSQWALFLRNHDELTLAIVTDEERDYMYRMYAQTHQARLYLGIRRRLAPLLGNDRKSIELLNALLFSLPGTPVLYYGDEIGLGDNIYLGDRNGVRTPMQWSSDKNAGFSRANPQSLYLPIILDPAYHYEAVNVEEQLANPHSLLWWMRRLLALRKRWRALGEGRREFLQPENHKILSYVLRFEQETLLVVANLSRFAQPVELELAAFKGMIPVELFGRMKFPAITDAPYPLTLGPHNFYWFSLEPKPQPLAASPTSSDPAKLPALTLNNDWREIFTGRLRAKFEALLPDYLKAQPWFLSKVKTIKLATIREFFELPLPDGSAAVLVFLQVEFVEANPELYFWPLAFAVGSEAARLQTNGIMELTWPDGRLHGLVHDALASSTFARAALESIQRGDRLKNGPNEIHATRSAEFSPTFGAETVIHGTSDGNVVVFFGDKIAVKFFRRVEAGINPELEVGRFLTEKKFPNCAPLLAAWQYNGTGEMSMTLAVVKAFIPQSKNAWDFTLDDLSRYYDRVFADVAQGHAPTAIPDDVADYVGIALESARHLGARTAELHLTLISDLEGDEFSAEPMTPQYLRGLFQSMRSLAVLNLRQLRKQLKLLPPDLSPVAQRVLELEPVIIQHFQKFTAMRIMAKRTRVHGDLHLGQMLWTGREYIFLDFEGDATVPMSERRIKRSPLRDVARLLRSFHHAAYAGLRQQVESGIIAPDSVPRFEPWVRHWNRAFSRAYLQSYCQSLGQSGILPDDPEQLRVMLLAYLLNQVMDELGDELRAHSDNVRAPLQAIILLTDEHMLQQIQSALTGKSPAS